MNRVLMWVPYKASAAVAAHRLVEPGANDGEVRQGASDAAKLIGVSGSRPVAADETVEVATVGIADVEYGGNVARGDLLTADASGKAIATAAAGKRVVGTAVVSGIDGDIGEVLVSPGSV